MRRSLSLASALSLVLSVTAFTPGAMNAATDPEARFQAFDLGRLSSAITPVGLDPNQKTTVFVELAGDPVAVAQGNAGAKLSKAQAQAIKQSLKAQQDALAPRIAALGGTVSAQFQAALNGVNVEIARGQVAKLAALPGVTAIRQIDTLQMDNATSVPYIGAPAVWDGVSGLHGEGVKVAIIDSGIDYTHADFGGPGSVAAFLDASASSTSAADPSMFGPAAPKVKGGIDLVGNDFNAAAPAGSPARTPHPDPNPLDCGGHGSHVAGTAAGFGVTAAGATYTGPYDASTYSTSFNVGPGVAPKADLYAVRVFGCSGSTNVVSQAIEWAVDNDMDVINMSLGSSFGSSQSSSAVAAANAAKAGVTVVASSGNSGPAPYITSSPGTGEGVISVAANDSTASFPGAHLALNNGTSLDVINANGASFTEGVTWPIVVLRTSTGAVSLGCDPAEYVAAGVAGKLVVTQRGTCARVARAIFGQKAGATAVVMINNDNVYPPFEGQITSNPDTGEQYTVTIPFFGATSGDGPRLLAASATSATATTTTIANPAFSALASFTSGGPRNGDSALKPDITAPGVSISSTAMGTGTEGAVMSGTSMAAPHVAGVAALTRQAHPAWRNSEINAAIVNTGSPSAVAGYRTSLGGSGLVQPAAAARTQATATATGDKGGTNLGFGFKELGGDYSETKRIAIRNRGPGAITFNVATANAGGRPHSVALGTASLTVPAGGVASVGVTLNVPAASVGSSAAFREVAGVVTFTPATGADNNGVTLRVPYYLVPRALSDIKTKLDGKLSVTNTSTTATATNDDGVIAGTADFYAWGLEDTRDSRVGSDDIRAVGIQSFASPTAADPTRRLLVIAISTWDRWSNAATNEFDVFLDVDRDGTADFVVVGVDVGAVTANVFNGQMGSFIFNARTGALASATFFNAVAPTDSSTLLLPFRTNQIPGLSMATNPRFDYQAAGFAIFTTGDDNDNLEKATFNAWTSSISQGDFLTVAPGGSASTPVTINATEWTHSPAKGLLVVSTDNRSGAKEADLLSVSR